MFFVYYRFDIATWLRHAEGDTCLPDACHYGRKRQSRLIW